MAWCVCGLALSSVSLVLLAAGSFILAAYFQGLDALRAYRDSKLILSPANEKRWAAIPGDTKASYTTYIYLFNITNPHEVVAGVAKPRVEEVGPFAFTTRQEYFDLTYKPRTVQFRRRVTYEYSRDESLPLNTTVATVNLGPFGLFSNIKALGQSTAITARRPTWQAFRRLVDDLNNSLPPAMYGLAANALVKFPLELPAPLHKARLVWDDGWFGLNKGLPGWSMWYQALGLGEPGWGAELKQMIIDHFDPVVGKDYVLKVFDRLDSLRNRVRAILVRHPAIRKAAGEPPSWLLKDKLEEVLVALQWGQAFVSSTPLLPGVPTHPSVKGYNASLPVAPEYAGSLTDPSLKLTLDEAMPLLSRSDNGSLYNDYESFSALMDQHGDTGAVDVVVSRRALHPGKVPALSDKKRAAMRSYFEYINAAFIWQASGPGVGALDAVVAAQLTQGSLMPGFMHFAHQLVDAASVRRLLADDGWLDATRQTMRALLKNVTSDQLTRLEKDNRFGWGSPAGLFQWLELEHAGTETIKAFLQNASSASGATVTVDMYESSIKPQVFAHAAEVTRQWLSSRVPGCGEGCSLLSLAALQWGGSHVTTALASVNATEAQRLHYLSSFDFVPRRTRVPEFMEIPHAAWLLYKCGGAGNGASCPSVDLPSVQRLFSLAFDSLVASTVLQEFLSLATNNRTQGAARLIGVDASLVPLISFSVLSTAFDGGMFTTLTASDLLEGYVDASLRRATDMGLLALAGTPVADPLLCLNPNVTDPPADEPSEMKRGTGDIRELRMMTRSKGRALIEQQEVINTGDGGTQSKNLEVWTGPDGRAHVSVYGTDGVQAPPDVSRSVHLWVYDPDLMLNIPFVYQPPPSHPPTTARRSARAVRPGDDPYGIQPLVFITDTTYFLANASTSPAFFIHRDNLLNLTAVKNAPLFASAPYFADADPSLREMVGMAPPSNDSADLVTFLSIEPWSGIPLITAKRIQISAHVAPHVSSGLLAPAAREAFVPVFWMEKVSRFPTDSPVLTMVHQGVYWNGVLSRFASTGGLSTGVVCVALSLIAIIVGLSVERKRRLVSLRRQRVADATEPLACGREGGDEGVPEKQEDEAGKGAMRVDSESTEAQP
ncbi:unnamed protein product [Vitrella brassicaformis CCMP3155]|uniref:CD36 family protein n=2 Tax=Vitrella brassicaformis TaxID=1169539 RepID=A0A0G4EKN5_VITBC|nr:unnamed protein product [Vitrella brassicaformis CCMP3155]|eukprot:CEL96989.1 unnamed protein product [Vitrella brassicaformis CCMP3155]